MNFRHEVFYNDKIFNNKNIKNYLFVDFQDIVDEYSSFQVENIDEIILKKFRMPYKH